MNDTDVAYALKEGGQGYQCVARFVEHVLQTNERRRRWGRGWSNPL